MTHFLIFASRSSLYCFAAWLSAVCSSFGCKDNKKNVNATFLSIFFSSTIKKCTLAGAVACFFSPRANTEKQGNETHKNPACFLLNFLENPSKSSLSFRKVCFAT